MLSGAYGSRNILFIHKHPYACVCVCVCVECVFLSCLLLQMASFYKHCDGGSILLYSAAHL